VSARVEHPRGHPKNPMTYDEIAGEVHAPLAPVIGERQAGVGSSDLLRTSMTHRVSASVIDQMRVNV